MLDKTSRRIIECLQREFDAHAVTAADEAEAILRREHQVVQPRSVVAVEQLADPGPRRIDLDPCVEPTLHEFEGSEGDDGLLDAIAHDHDATGRP